MNQYPKWRFEEFPAAVLKKKKKYCGGRRTVDIADLLRFQEQDASLASRVAQCVGRPAKSSRLAVSGATSWRGAAAEEFLACPIACPD
jgi:hypothetical protein